MHSRVFHVETDKTIKEDLAYELEENGFVGEVADYAVNIAPDDDGPNGYDNAVNWFKEVIEKRLGNLVTFYDDNSFEFSAGFKQKWFKDSFEDLKSIINNMSLDDFASSGMLTYKIQNMIEAKFEFYIYSIDNSYSTLDEFIREDAIDHVKYYINNIVDYHS